MHGKLLHRAISLAVLCASTYLNAYQAGVAMENTALRICCRTHLIARESPRLTAFVRPKSDSADTIPSIAHHFLLPHNQKVHGPQPITTLLRRTDAAAPQKSLSVTLHNHSPTMRSSVRKSVPILRQLHVAAAYRTLAPPLR